MLSSLSILSSDPLLQNSSDTLSYTSPAAGTRAFLEPDGLHLSSALASDFDGNPHASEANPGLHSQGTGAVFSAPSMVHPMPLILCLSRLSEAPQPVPAWVLCSYDHIQPFHVPQPGVYEATAEQRSSELQAADMEVSVFSLAHICYDTCPPFIPCHIYIAYNTFRDAHGEDSKKINELTEQVHFLVTGYKEFCKTMLSTLENRASGPLGVSDLVYIYSKKLPALNRADFGNIPFWPKAAVERGSGRLRSKSEIWNVDPDRQPNVCVCVCATRSREQVYPWVINLYPLRVHEG